MKQRKKTSALGTGCGVVFLGAIIIGIVASIFSGGNDSSSSSSAITTKAPAKPVNLRDASALDQAYGIPAAVACGAGADDYLRQAAKWDFKWDKLGFLDQRFDQYLKVVSAPGVITEVSNKVALQNGFGAYQRVELLCKYDTQANKVLEYSIVQ